MESIQSEYSSLSKRLRSSEKKVSSSSEDIKEQYLSAIQESLQVCEQLQKVMTSVEDRKRDLADYLCEDVSTFSLDDLFGTIKTFRGLFLKALKENENRRDLEKKKKKREDENKLKGNSDRMVRREVNQQDEGCIIDNLMAEIRKGHALKKTRTPSRRGSRGQRRGSLPVSAADTVHARLGSIRRSKAVEDPESPHSSQSQKTSGMTPVQEDPPSHPGSSGQSEKPSKAVQTPATPPSSSSTSNQSATVSPSGTSPGPRSAEPPKNQSPQTPAAIPAGPAKETRRRRQGSLEDSGLETRRSSGQKGVQSGAERPAPSRVRNSLSVADGSEFEYISSSEVRGIGPENGENPNESPSRRTHKIRPKGRHDRIRSQSPRQKKGCVVQ